jgi:universal stress protein A
MNIKSILFPTDFSRYNEPALTLASTLAAEAKAVLHIVHVQDVQELSAAMGEAAFIFESTLDKEQDAIRDRLAEVLPTAPAVTYEHHFLTGSPVIEIVNFAVEKDVDLIVMASHGRTGISRLLMGSIAEGVMRRARCPVLIVKQPGVEGEQHHQLFSSHADTRLLS